MDSKTTQDALKVWQQGSGKHLMLCDQNRLPEALNKGMNRVLPADIEPGKVWGEGARVFLDLAFLATPSQL